MTAALREENQQRGADQQGNIEIIAENQQEELLRIFIRRGVERQEQGCDPGAGHQSQEELYEVVHMQIESGGVFINLDGIPYLIRQIGYEKIGDEAEQEIFCGGGLSKIAVQIADEIADGNAKGSGQSPEQAEQRRQERRNPDIGIGKIENRF